MDLGRFSFRHVGRFLEDVLDGEIELDAQNNDVRDAFDVNESTEDLDRALALLRPGASAIKILNAFTPFFEGGLCLKVVDGETRLMSLFLFGQPFKPSHQNGTPVNLGLKRMELNRVYRASIGPIMDALDLSTFFRLEGASAFSFALSKDTVFIFFDHRPHPWQVFAVENAYFSARETFARLVISKPAVMSSRGFFK